MSRVKARGWHSTTERGRALPDYLSLIIFIQDGSGGGGGGQGTSDSVLTFWKDLATIAAALVAAGTLFSGYRQYRQQNRQKRYEFVAQMRDKAAKDANFQNITRLLEIDGDGLAEIPLRDRSAFLAFYEELALMVNSRFINKEVAHYLFGKYLVLSWYESEDFWVPIEIGGVRRGLNRALPHWSVLEGFAEEMRVLHEERERADRRTWLKKKKRKLRF